MCSIFERQQLGCTGQFMSNIRNNINNDYVSSEDFIPLESNKRLYAIFELAKLQREAHLKYGNPYPQETDEFESYRTGYELGKLNVSLPDVEQLAILDQDIITDILKPLMYNDFSLTRLGRDVLVFFGEGSDIMTLDSILNELYPNNNRTVFKDENVNTRHYQLSFYFDTQVVNKDTKS
jgi:hypothetical protein